jgi:hypothetical protein
MEINGGNGDKVSAEVIGSGQLTLVGSTRELAAAVRGSGELDARHLRAEEATLEHQGSGSSALYASRGVHVEMTGSGDSTVFGNPDRRSVSGTGAAASISATSNRVADS